ncbi:MAG: AAC(3) family N-acetyltransferase [Chloroflexota bacterium]
MAVRLRDLLLGLRSLELDETPVVVHASLSAFGEVEGGAKTVVSALESVFEAVLVPAFTYKTMVTPLVGPEGNGLKYGSGTDLNRMAEFFTPEMPADPLMGVIPETVRRHPHASRSGHPILSFAGFNAADFLAAQTIANPFGPLGALEKANGWVILIGVGHTVNTSIHYAEKMTGRRTFTRWALTPDGIVECPNFPGCSAGFEALAPTLEQFTRKAQVGEAQVQAVPLAMLFKAVFTSIKRNRQALLCSQTDCERCGEIRNRPKRGESP